MEITMMLLQGYAAIAQRDTLVHLLWKKLSVHLENTVQLGVLSVSCAHQGMNAHHLLLLLNVITGIILLRAPQCVPNA